jgi:hypothetical protein
MPLSSYAQEIMALKSFALPPSDDLANMLDSVKKSLGVSASSGQFARTSGAQNNFRSFGRSDGRNDNRHDNRNNYRHESRSGDSGPKSWNGFRKNPAVPQYETMNKEDSSAPKSIPIKVDSDGWVSIGERRKQKAAASTSDGATSASSIKFRTGRPQTKATEDAILNNVILGKLNKFSEANFDDCREFLQQILDGDQKDFLRAFMKLVFEKAAMENTFCPLYAKLLGSLVEKYPVILEEMNALHSKYMEIFSNIAEKSDDYDKFVEENKKKAYRLGYSQFLGELIKLDILSRDMLFGIVKNILDRVCAIECEEGYGDLVEEYTDCLIKLMKAFGERGMSPLRVDLNEEFGSIIETLSKKRVETKSIPAKARFGFMDCLDILRKK